jgi:hypothetical protein
MNWSMPPSVPVAASLAAILVMSSVGAASATAGASKSLTFEAVFSPAGEPASLHYRALFKARGGDHQFEVWRDGERRVKRVTDAALITYAVRKPGDADFDLQLLDLQKRTSTHIDRATMYRLGNFTDWFDLTHALRHPKGGYQLVRSPMRTAAAPAAFKPVAACDWYTLTESGRATRLCWSHADRLPLLILSPDGIPAWRVTAIDRAPFAASVFTVADQNFVRVDTVKDAERD